MASQPDPLRARGEEIHVLASFISTSKELERVPRAFVRVMESGAWQHWRNELGRDVQPADFKEFVETKYPSGLGTTLEILRKIITGNPRALDLYDAAMQRKPGGDRRSDSFKSDNVTLDKSDRGNSEAYSLRKLRKDAPEIHAEVLAGKISPHAGMVKAGFRKRTFTVPVEPQAVARAILRNFNQKDIEKIIKTLAGI